MTSPTCAECGTPFATRNKSCRRHDAWEERAAIYEHDGKLTREKAERRAVLEMARAVYGGGK